MNYVFSSEIFSEQTMKKTRELKIAKQHCGMYKF